MDVERAADLYAEGWTLRQIGAELGLAETTVSDHLRRAGVTMRRGGPSAHPASTQLIVELRDQGLTWPEIAEQVGMTVSGVWSRYRRARPPERPRLGRWQQVLADALDGSLAIGVRAAVADHLGCAPTPAELTTARRAAHRLAAPSRARVLHLPGVEADANAGECIGKGGWIDVADAIKDSVRLPVSSTRLLIEVTPGGIAQAVLQN